MWALAGLVTALTERLFSVWLLDQTVNLWYYLATVVVSQMAMAACGCMAMMVWTACRVVRGTAL